MTEREIVEDLVAEIRRPDSIRSVRVEFGTDSTDYPAVWIVALVDRKLETSARNLSELNAYWKDMTMAALARIPDRWPYVTIRAEPKAGRGETSRRPA